MTTTRELFHILYADEVRLNSLDAQINKRVPSKFTDIQSQTMTDNVYGEGSIPAIAKGGAENSESQTKTSSVEFTFRDAQYFAVMESLGIDLANPRKSLDDIVPDGNIHAFNGKLQVVSLASSKPLIDTIKVLASQMKKSPNIFGAKADKATIQGLNEFESIADLILKIPAPPSFLLSLSDGKSIYGPVIEPSVRLPLADQALVFGSCLPFEWTVVGYLYPMESEHNTGNNGFLFTMADSLSAMRNNINPQSNAIMVPLLILR